MLPTLTHMHTEIQAEYRSICMLHIILVHSSWHMLPPDCLIDMALQATDLDEKLEAGIKKKGNKGPFKWEI